MQLNIDQNFIESRRLKDIENGHAPDLVTDVWKRWRHGNGCLSNLITHAPHLILSDSIANDGEAPLIRSAGKLTPAVRIFGRGWSDKIQSSGLTPIKEWDAFVAKGYFEAAQGDPVFDTVNFIAVINGVVYRVLYDRGLFPVDVAGENARLIACAAHVREMRELGRLQ